MRQLITKTVGKSRDIAFRVRGKVTTAILAAFAFVIAFVWRDAIRDVIDMVVERLNVPASGYIYSIITALIVTFLCVLGIIFFSRWSEKK